MTKLSPENMNVAFVKDESKSQADEDQFFKGQEVKLMDKYSVNYTVQSLDDILPSGTMQKWDQWLQGGMAATSIEKSISDFVAQNGLEVVPHKVPVPQSPKQIEGIPQSLGFEEMFAVDFPYSNKYPIDTLLFGLKPENIVLPVGTHQGKDPEVWYRSGWTRPNPKVMLSLSLNPLRLPNEPPYSALKDLQLELYGRLLTEELNPKLVDLTVTGMSYTIGVGVGGGGLDFDFVGFEPSMQTLITKVVSEFNAFNRDPSLTPMVRWKRVMGQLHEDLTSYTDLPMNYAIKDRNLLLTSGEHHRTELLEELKKNIATLADASSSVSDTLLSRPLRLTALAMGNMGKDKASTMIGDFLHSIEYPAGASQAQIDDGADVVRTKPILDLKRPVEVRKLNPRQGDKNDVAVVSVVAGVSTVESRVLLGLLSSLYRPLAYNELRTEQQIGYIVSASVVLLSNVHLMSCVVQGNRIGADAMEAAIHRVNMDLMPKRLEAMSDEEFQAFKQSFRQELLQPPVTMKEEFKHFKGPIDQGGIGFDLLNEMLRFLAGPLATKEALQVEWQRLMFPKEGERAMVVLKYFAQEKGQTGTTPRTLEQARQIWAKYNVSQDAKAMLEREFNASKVLSKVDSKERIELMKEGRFFPTEQHLQLKDPALSASSEPLIVPEQLKELAKERAREKAMFASTSVQYSADEVAQRLTGLAAKRRGGRLRSSVLAPSMSE